MAFCDSTTWQMRLTLAQLTERLDFVLTITHGEVRGDVLNFQAVRMSRVRGRCESIVLPGLPDLARMSFVFRFRKAGQQRGVAMSGFAFIPEGGTRAEFQGRFRVFQDNIDLPAPGAGELLTIQALPETGETGTGTGQQT